MHGAAKSGRSNFARAGPPGLLWNWNLGEMTCETWIVWKDCGPLTTTLKEMQGVSRGGNCVVMVERLSVVLLTGDLLHPRALVRVMPLLERVGRLDRSAPLRYRPGHSRGYLYRLHMSDRGSWCPGAGMRDMDCTGCRWDPLERSRRYRKAWIGQIDSGGLRAIATDDLTVCAGKNLANAEKQMDLRRLSLLRVPTRPFSEQEGSKESWHDEVDRLEMFWDDPWLFRC